MPPLPTTWCGFDSASPGMLARPATLATLVTYPGEELAVETGPRRDAAAGDVVSSLVVIVAVAAATTMAEPDTAAVSATGLEAADALV